MTLAARNLSTTSQHSTDIDIQDSTVVDLGVSQYRDVSNAPPPLERALGQSSIMVSSPVMFAIIDVKGTQFKVVPDDLIFPNKMDVEVGQKIVIERVLMIANTDFSIFGTPVVGCARVHATVEQQFKAKKVINFRKIRRKGFERTRGHRARLTGLRILAIEYELEEGVL